MSTRRNQPTDDTQRLGYEADDGWPIQYQIGEIGLLLALALVVIFAPYEAPMWARFVAVGLIALIGLVELAFEYLFKPNVRSFMVLSAQVLLIAVGSGLIPEFWLPNAIALLLVCLVAVILEARVRAIALSAAGGLALIATGLLHGDLAPTNWYVGLIVGFGVIASTEIWIREWSERRSRLIERHGEMLDRARTFSWEVDRETQTIRGIAGNVEGVLGYTADELIGRRVDEIAEIQSDVSRSSWLEGDEQHAVVTATHRNGDEVTIHEVRLQSDDPSVLRGVSTDMTEAARASRALRYQADHDALTGLLNQSALRRAVDARLATSSEGLALFVLDLDRFKDVNDTLGHQTGDLLLAELATRLRAHLGETDTIGRVGGDEFAVCIEDDPTTTVVDRAKALVELLAIPAEIDGFRLAISASLGIAFAPEHGTTYDELHHHADIASYAAKRERTQVEVFTSTGERLSRRRLRLLSEMPAALAGGQFELFLQPKVRLSDRSLVGAAGLARWHHPELGLLQPAEFMHTIEIAADHQRFTTEMLRQAIDFGATLQAQGRRLPVSVSLAGMNLRDLGLAERLTQLADEADLDPSILIIEIDEGHLDIDDPVPASVVADLKHRGFAIAIDDFGTGTGSVMSLRALRPSEVKINQFFTSAGTAQAEDRLILRAGIEVATALGCTTVAEGVETAEQADLLQSLGCDVAQGYFFAHPMPQSEFLAAMAGPNFGALNFPKAADQA